MRFAVEVEVEAEHTVGVGEVERRGERRGSTWGEARELRSGKVSVYISVLVVGAGREPVDAPGGVCCRQGSCWWLRRSEARREGGVRIWYLCLLSSLLKYRFLQILRAFAYTACGPLTHM